MGPTKDAMKKGFRYLLAATCALMSAAAYPLDISLPLRGTFMEFFSGLNHDDKDVIFINGMIDNTAARDFRNFVESHGITKAEVYFNSQGGNMMQALDLGDLIRKYRFNTNIGIPSKGELEKFGNDKLIYSGKIKPGTCASACVYAYAGGVGRFWTEDYCSEKMPSSRMGLHQFTYKDGDNGVRRGQVLSAALVAYLTEKGVSPLAFTVSVLANPDDILWIDRKQAESFNLVNNGFEPATAEVGLVDGLPFISLVQLSVSPQSGNSAEFIFSAIENEPGYLQCFGAIITNPTASRNMKRESVESDFRIGGESLGLLPADESIFAKSDYLVVARTISKARLLDMLKDAGSLYASANTGGALCFPARVSLKDKKVKQKLIEFVRNIK